MQGTVCVVTNPDGEVFAHGVDVEQGKPAGWTLENIQEMRAEATAWRDAFNGGCHPDMAAAITAHRMTAEAVAREMRDRGWKATFRTFDLPERADPA